MSAIRPDGVAVLAGVERAVIRSRAKLAYATVTLSDLPPAFPELASRIERAEAARQADRVDAPEQEVIRRETGFELRFRPRREIERRSAALSLATNLAVADRLLAARTGLFRTMQGVDDAQLRRLHHIARAFGLNWPAGLPLGDYLRTLPEDDPRTGAFQLAVRRAGGAPTTSRTARVWCRGTRRSPRRTATPRHRCAASAIAT